MSKGREPLHEFGPFVIEATEGLPPCRGKHVPLAVLGPEEDS